ncbi:MAG: MOSC domain-containing protein [Nitrospirota bacterium]|nr:MOSC domain-containing protein [Nitrospirota bacterium]
MFVKYLNIGLPKKELFHGKEFTTGICKKPVAGPLLLSRTGFIGDGVGDLRYHGGSDKAVCVYSLDHYPYWTATLGIALPEAAFGENLTVTGMLEPDICIGDTFRIGSAVVQVSQPRQPCRTLAARYGREDFVKLVVESGRTGFYFRTLTEGAVNADDMITLVQRDPFDVTVEFANHIYHHDRRNREGIERVLAAPALSESWRKSFQELREKI